MSRNALNEFRTRIIVFCLFVSFSMRMQAESAPLISEFPPELTRISNNVVWPLYDFRPGIYGVQYVMLSVKAEPPSFPMPTISIVR